MPFKANADRRHRIPKQRHRIAVTSHGRTPCRSHRRRRAGDPVRMAPSGAELPRRAAAPRPISAATSFEPAARRLPKPDDDEAVVTPLRALPSR